MMEKNEYLLGGNKMDSMKELREKNWEELAEKEKCERLRQQVKSLQKIVDRLSRESGKMEAHLHLGDNLVVPMFSLPSGESEQSNRRSTEYF